MLLWVSDGLVRIFASRDLRSWDVLSDFRGEGFYECRDIVCLPVDDEPGVSRWALYDAALRYWIGRFDGVTFTPEAAPTPECPSTSR